MITNGNVSLISEQTSENQRKIGRHRNQRIVIGQIVSHEILETNKHARLNKTKSVFMYKRFLIQYFEPGLT